MAITFTDERLYLKGVTELTVSGKLEYHTTCPTELLEEQNWKEKKMAILIPDMDMPKCCADCRLYDDRWDYPTCYYTNSARGYNFKIHELRMPDCPLYEVDIDFNLFKLVVDYCKSHTYSEFVEMNRMYEESKHDKV